MIKSSSATTVDDGKDKTISREARSLLASTPGHALQFEDHAYDSSDYQDPSLKHRPRPLDIEKPLKVILPKDNSALARELQMYCNDTENEHPAIKENAKITKPSKKKKKGETVAAKKVTDVIDIPPYRDIVDYNKEFLLAKKITESNAVPPRGKGKGSDSSAFIKFKRGNCPSNTYEIDDEDEVFINHLRKEAGWITVELFEQMIEQLERESFLSNYLLKLHNDKIESTIRFQKSLSRLERLYATIDNTNLSPEEIKIDETDQLMCSVCLKSDDHHELLICDVCSLVLHPECYCVKDVARINNLTPWTCYKCAYEIDKDSEVHRECVLCKSTGGAVMPICEVELSGNEAIEETSEEEEEEEEEEDCINKKRWSHVICALNIPELSVTPQGISGIEKLPKRRYQDPCIMCSLSGKSNGAVSECGHIGCDAVFHATCALKAKCSISKQKVYCPSHSTSDLSTPDDVVECLQICMPPRKAKDILEALAKKTPRTKSVVDTLYKYWVSKRVGMNGVPLLRCFHTFALLENWAVDFSLPSKPNVKIPVIEKYMQDLVRKRREVERARMIADMVRRREKLKRERTMSMYSIVDAYIDSMSENQDDKMDKLKEFSLIDLITTHVNESDTESEEEYSQSRKKRKRDDNHTTATQRKKR